MVGIGTKGLNCSRVCNCVHGQKEDERDSECMTWLGAMREYVYVVDRSATSSQQLSSLR